MITSYKTVTGNINKTSVFDEKVNELVASGYQPMGNSYVINKNIYQNMVYVKKDYHETLYLRCREMNEKGEAYGMMIYIPYSNITSVSLDTITCDTQKYVPVRFNLVPCFFPEAQLTYKKMFEEINLMRREHNEMQTRQ